MAFAWKKAAEGQSKMSEGFHYLTISKLGFTDKDGAQLASKQGEPQIRVFVTNQDGEGGRILVTLSKNGAWVLAQMLEHAGADLERMEAAGVEPASFEDAAFASKQLLGRKFWGQCEHKGEYANIRSVSVDDVPPGELRKSGIVGQHQATRQPAPAATAQQGSHQAVEEDAIPF